ncbi:MAG: CapA family protein [Oscillospiraceae bacterium]|nr:CapA family protein [Oscillospiraceae bacterium]
MARFGRKVNRSALSVGAKIGIAIAAVAVLAGIVAAVILLRPSDSETPGTGGDTQVGEDTVIHFVAGGDVNVTDKVVAAGGSELDYSDVFLDVMPVLSGGDLTTLNFEGNLYEQPYGSKHNSAPVELVQALRGAGVDILQTANSKSITNGILGLSSTLDGIRSAGMQSVGTYATEEQFQRYQGFLIREVNGIRIAITAFTKGMDGRGLPGGSEHCVNLLYEDYNSAYQKVDEDGIQSVLKAIDKQQPDITIALLHWGSEFNDQVSKTQQEIIEIMADGGVDAIVGTHPHYVQKIGFDADTGMLIAYSLGDFFGDGDKAGTNYSVILDLEITKDGATGKASVSDYSYVPIYRYESEIGEVKLLRIREALTAYENRSIDAVTAEDYEAMKNALARIEDRVNG